jgi:hypothetical protein
MQLNSQSELVKFLDKSSSNSQIIESVSETSSAAYTEDIEIERKDMPNVDPGILCFQHCNNKSKVFCFELPDYCPQCDAPMNCISLKIPPFHVPFPFTCAKRTQCSVVIRPTNGDFLQ